MTLFFSFFISSCFFLEFRLCFNFNGFLITSAKWSFAPPRNEWFFLFTVHRISETVKIWKWIFIPPNFRNIYLWDYLNALINSTCANGCTRNWRIRLHVKTSLKHWTIEPIVYPSESRAIAPVSKFGLIPLHLLQKKPYENFLQSTVF